MATRTLLLVSLACLIGVAAAGVCSGGCVCIPGVVSLCGNTTTEIYWEDLLPSGSSAVVDVVPGSFEQGGHINLLDLSNNPSLTLHNDSFSGLPNLLSLDLSHSSLAELPDQLFTPLTKLEHLDLSYNDLTSVNPAAFEGVDSLQSLMLSFNQLSTFPLPEFLPQLEEIPAIYLYPNQVDCSSSDIVSLLQLLDAGVVADGTNLRCSNGTLVQFLIYELPTPAVTMTPTASYLVTPTPTIPSLASVTTVSGVRSVIGVTATPTPVTATPTPVTATPTPVIVYCEAEAIQASFGLLNWPNTMAASVATIACPTNENKAFRSCLSDGQWGVANDSLCEVGVTVTQLLDSISKLPITTESSERLSLQLVISLTFDLRLTSDELDTLTDLVTELVGVASGNVEVLNNTLYALNTVLVSSSSQLSTHTTQRLRSLVDTVLLDALSLNRTNLVLSYSSLAVGGAYLPASNQSSLLAYIRFQTNSSVGIEIGGTGEGSSDVTVKINGGQGGVQVTVYEGDDLFNQSNCSNATGEVGGNVVSPVITVTNEDSDSDESEVVTISYNDVSTAGGLTRVCVRWITFDCGGGVWSQSGCSLVTSDTGQLQCRCLQAGSYAVLDVTESVISEGELPLISRIVFHVLVSVTLPLYLTIFLIILSSRALLSLPSLQCVLFLSLSQALSLLLMELSLPQPPELCYSLATLTHYTVLVTLSWMIVYPILEALKVFKMIWYEKSWLIAPFAAISFMWPAIPVVIYAVLRHSEFPESPEFCWLEVASFPNTFTYIFGFTGLVVIVTTFVTLILLACSDYTIQPSIYLKIISSLVTFALYVGIFVSQFFTASSEQFGIRREYLVMVTAGLACLCGILFFVSHTLTQSRVRHVLTCQKDPELKRKSSPYKHSPRTADSGFHSRSSPRVARTRRPATRLTDELNINYVDDYLGYPHGNSPVPLAMLGAVRDGNRVKSGFFTNPLYNMSLSEEL